MIDVTIPEDVRDEVLFPIGYPFLDEDDFDELLPENTKSIDVIQRFINKAIRKYNRVDPPLYKETYTQISNDFEIPYPEGAFSILNARPISIKGRGVLGPNAVTNTFANLNSMTNSGMMAGAGGRAFGTPYNYGMSTRTFLYNKARMQGIRDSTKNFMIENSPEERILRGYLNMKSDVRVTWILTISRWEQIPFTEREYIIQLASAYLLQWLGNLIEKEQIGDLAVDLDGLAYINQGKDLETEVKEIWQTYPNITKA